MTIKEVCKSEYSRILFGDFLDEFYREKDKQLQVNMIIEEPDFNEDDKIFLVEMAAAVHKLSNDFHLPVPSWVFKRQYFLSVPYYAFDTKNKDYQELLAKTSPKEYAERNIFYGENVLRRV